MKASIFPAILSLSLLLVACSDAGDLEGTTSENVEPTQEELAKTLTVSTNQVAGVDAYDPSICGGIKLNFQLQGVTKVELESVDGYALA